MRAGLAGCLAVALLSGCASLAGESPDAAECRDAHGTETTFQLCVSIDRQRADYWFVRRMGMQDRPLQGLSFTDYGQASFGEFSISPLGTWLAVTTAEEGHPSLHIRHLHVLLSFPDGEQPDLPYIAVYPGSLSIEGWADDASLLVSSDQDLTQSLRGGEPGEEQTFAIHLPDGAISRAATPSPASR